MTLLLLTHLSPYFPFFSPFLTPFDMATPSILCVTPPGLKVFHGQPASLSVQIRPFALGECKVWLKLPDAAVDFVFLENEALDPENEPEAWAETRFICVIFRPESPIKWHTREVHFVLKNYRPSERPILLDLILEAENGKGEKTSGDHRLNITFSQHREESDPISTGDSSTPDEA